MPLLARSFQRGTSLIEVLVTLVIVAIGLLGLAGLQSRMQMSEVESYQRSQALVLLNDMANRLAVNRSAAGSYVTTATSPVGAGIICPVDPAPGPEAELAEWCNALQGAGEMSGGNRTGAMLGGRGCIEALPNNEYLLTVAWQGLMPVSPPSVGLACGAGAYDEAGTPCIRDRCRRTVSTVVRLGTLL